MPALIGAALLGCLAAPAQAGIADVHEQLGGEPRPDSEFTCDSYASCFAPSS